MTDGIETLKALGLEGSAMSQLTVTLDRDGGAGEQPRQKPLSRRAEQRG